MSRLTLPFVLCAALLLAACGGSKHPTAGSVTQSSSSSPPGSASSTSSAAGSTTTTSSSTGAHPAEVPPGTKTVASSSSGASGTTSTSSAPTHVELPATFTIRGGSLQPPSIEAPVSVPVALTVVSGDGRAHTVLLRTPRPQTLHVPARGRVSVALTGLRAGRYVIDVDRSGGGALVIGGQPGP